MQRIILVLSLFFCDLTAKTDAKAKNAMVKSFGIATVISGLVTYYCYQKWLSSAEYVAFEDMKKKFKDAGMVVKVKKNVSWCGYGTVIITNTRYRTSKNMNSSEFYDWIDQYEDAEENTNNGWMCAALLMGCSTFCSLLVTFIGTLD